MQSDASAVPDQGGNADNDNHSPVGSVGVGDGTGPQSDSSPAYLSSVSLTCPECGQTFRRREHLIRHLDRHSGRRSYTCDVCKTAFSRRDTLKRHIGTHGTAALADWTRNNPRFSRDQQYRACEACAKAKQRCDGRRPAPCTKCTNKGRRCVYQPNPGDEETETIVVAQPAANNAVSATHSSPSQQVQPLTPMSCVPLQPWVEPELSWDTLLTSAQFLLPFSPVPSLEARALADFYFEDAALATAGQLMDDHSVQDSFGAEATQRGAVEAVEAFIGPDNLTAEDDDILIAENIPHVPPVTEETRVYMIQAIQARLPQHEAQGLDANFPSLRHLDTYMQLYFEHFHPRMPLLHVPTFQASPETWQLVLSVVCLGSRYSQAHHHHDHVLLLQRVAQHMVKRDVRPTLELF
ncbi:Zinc finger protein 444 [Fusarium oxysporum f. sp. cubense]|uniref:Zinc finger protein 444 n=1 Tax=Fusarium oxysporum f. sp. cubense TaxID=61366 RepID=A0A559KTP3_FUSOC|nr:Zinc finger protein 444 [Fusarium oxysporum f. sp. cubense]